MSGRVKLAPAATDKTRYIGLELEFITNASPNPDGNVTGAPGRLGIPWLEIDWESLGAPPGNGFEAAALLPEDTLAARVPVLTGLITDLGGRVTNSCGLHVHLDCRARDKARVCDALFDVQETLFKLCAPHRRSWRGNSGPVRERGYYDDRGQAFYAAYKYPTVEVRMKEATLDPDEILSWVAALRSVTDRIS